MVSFAKKFLFALIPAIVLFGGLEIGCLVWERFDGPAAALPQAEGELPEKEEGEFRVLFYGGSTVEGIPEPTVGFVAQLQVYLEELAPQWKYRFFNYGGRGNPSTYVVRRMDQTVRSGEADALVVMTAHNEFMPKENLSEEELKAMYVIQESMYRSALVRRARRLVYRYHTARRRELLTGDNLSYLDPDSARYQERVAMYERNVETIVQLANEAGVPLFLLTGAANLADWPPSNKRYSRYADDTAYDSVVSEIDVLLREGKWDEAVSRAREGLDRFPGDALLEYGMGQGEMRRGNLREAKALFYEAKDLDPLPYRVLSRFNELVRSKTGRPGVYVIDIANLFDERSPKGVTGFKLITDNCHPTPEGAFLIATQLIDKFAEARLVEVEKPAEELVSLEGFLARAGRRANWVRYRLENARTAMKPPYLNFREAERNLKEALDLAPDNWEVLANVATILFYKGAKAEGERYLRQAAEKKGSAIDLNDTEKVPYLKEAMARAGYALPE